MKIILGSCGLSTEPITKTCEELVGKKRQDINAIVINEAIKGESGDHRWFVEELEHLAKTIGGNLEFIDIQAHPLDYVEKRIAEADLVYCFGGNTGYIANIFMKTGFEKMLPKILEEKVWVGSSAGSCVLCHKGPTSIQRTIYKEEYDANQYMGIIPIVFLPHLHGYFKFDERDIKQISKGIDLPVYALSDNAAIVIDENRPLEVVGEDYIVARRGEVL